MIHFDYSEDVGLTIVLPSKRVEDGNLKEPLKAKELASLIAAALEKEGMTDLTSLGVYALNLKIWIVKSNENEIKV